VRIAESFDVIWTVEDEIGGGLTSRHLL
jgi:hypothetical protein